jgi:hypothetical protein
MAGNTVAIRLTLLDNASGKLKTVGNVARTTQAKFKGLATAAAGLAAGAALAGAAFIRMGQEVADVVNTLVDLQAVTGVSVNTLQDLQLMARSSGMEIDEFREGLLKFSESIGKARAEAGPMADAFAELGLDPHTFRDNDDALRQTMERLQSIDDVNERNRISMQLFGGAAAHMAKAMQTDMGAAARAQELLGLRMNQSTEEAGEMQRALGLMGQVTDMLKVAAFNTFTGEGGFASGISVVVGILNGVITLLGDMGDVLFGLFKMIGYSISALVNAAAGDLDTAESHLRKAGDAKEQLEGGLYNLVTLNAFEQGTIAALDFQEAMELLGQEAEDGTQAMGDWSPSAEGAGNAAAEAARKMQTLKEQMIDITERMGFAANAARSTSSAFDQAYSASLRFAQTGMQYQQYQEIDGSWQLVGRSIDTLEQQIDAMARHGLEYDKSHLANVYATIVEDSLDQSADVLESSPVYREWSQRQYELLERSMAQQGGAIQFDEMMLGRHGLVQDSAYLSQMVPIVEGSNQIARISDLIMRNDRVGEIWRDNYASYLRETGQEWEMWSEQVLDSYGNVPRRVRRMNEYLMHDQRELFRELSQAGWGFEAMLESDRFLTGEDAEDMQKVAAALGTVYGEMENIAQWRQHYGEDLFDINTASLDDLTQHLDAQRNELQGMVEWYEGANRRLYTLVHEMADELTGGMEMGTTGGERYRDMAQLMDETLGAGAFERFQANIRDRGMDAMEALQSEMQGTSVQIRATVSDITATEAQIDKLKAKEARLERVQGFTEELTKWTSMVTQGVAGGDVIGMTGSALSQSQNPYVMAAGAVVSAFGGIAQLGELAKDSSVQEVSEGIIASAEEQIENIERGMEVFKEVLPELLTLIVTELPGAIIKAIPDIMMGLYEAMVMALREFWAGIKGLFGKTDEEREANKQARHDWANQYLSDFWDLITGNGDSYASGTSYVQRTGMALLHRGEAVIPQNGRASQGVHTGSAPVNINISASVIDRDVIPRLVREIERVTGRYGRMQASFA